MLENKKITVIQIITKLELGGAQKICLSLFENLESNNIQTYLFCSNEGLLVEKIKQNPNAILLSNLKREINFKNIFSELKAFIELIKQLKKLKKNNQNLIVHTHSTKAGLMGRWAALFAGIKYRVHTIHGYGFHKHQNFLVWSIIYFLEFITSFITTHFICVCIPDIKKGQKLLPKFKKKYSLIRAAIDFSQFKISDHNYIKFPEQNNSFVFGTIACFKPQKNIIDLLKAFTFVHFKNKKTRLEIIGDGTLRPTIEQWIKEHDLSDIVKIHGWKENVYNFMKNWNAFLLTSLWEGLPCAVVEARLLKLPVLSYNTDGIQDIIKDGYNGFLFKQKDWQSLSKAMLEITKNKELYNFLQTHQENLDDFKIENMIESHKKLYKSLIKS